MSKTGFKCPRCGNTEEFTAFSVILYGETHITEHGWNYFDYANDVELAPEAIMLCGKCKYEAAHEEFEVKRVAKAYRPCKEAVGKWYERIELAPYDGDMDCDVFALTSVLNMRIWFDDVNTETVRFMYQDSLDDPIVDYDITNEELTEWFEGRRKLVLVALEHDESRFPDMVCLDL